MMHETYEMAKYPLTIYGRGVTFLLTWVFPFAMASFYPASHLLGRDVGLLAWASPFVAAILLAIGYRFWRFGLGYYAGTGS
jgi:ABC-2 type transport system permease protein